MDEYRCIQEEQRGMEKPKNRDPTAKVVCMVMITLVFCFVSFLFRLYSADGSSYLLVGFAYVYA